MKPKAPVWLRESFRDGVDEGYAPACWLSHFDPFNRPCAERLERFHFISRQRVENALYALLPAAVALDEWMGREGLILLAAWDARNGGIACEAHHRRFDSHLTPPLIVPRSALPEHVEEFAADWGLEGQLEDRFPPAYRQGEEAVA